MQTAVKFLKILWSWPTFALILLVVFHADLSNIFYRVSTAPTAEAKLGSVSLSISGSMDPGISSDVELERVEDTGFGPEEVSLDGKEFLNCSFRGSILVFHGDRPFSMVGNELHGVQWRLDDSAALTVAALTNLYKAGGGMQKLVEGTLMEIRSGRYTGR